MSLKAKRGQRLCLKGIWKLLQIRVGKSKSAPALWYGIKLLLLTAVYFCAGHFGLSLEVLDGFATLVWLPAGIAVASLFLWGYNLWPAILLGAFLINLFTGAHPFVVSGISAGNTLGALICTVLLKRKSVRPEMDSLHDVLALVLVSAPIGSFVSATIGIGSLWLGRTISWPSVYATWGAWWFGDVISLFLFTPLIFTWSTWPHTKISFKHLIELGLFSACLLAVGIFVFLKLSHFNENSAPSTYLVFPPLIWAALRFGPRGATAALTALSSFAIVGTILNVSSFSVANLDERLFFVQGFMTITAITTLILAAIMAERCALEQRKNTFLSMVSHELRTPLTCLHGYIQLLQKQFTEGESPRALHALTVMEAQTRQLSRLIADLLDLSKIQAGKLTFREEVVDMDTLVRETVEQFQQTTSWHQITIKGHISGIVIGDQERLGQVLNNLMTNAIKYSPQAEHIIIHLTSTTEHLTVRIQDFGIGIPLTEQEKIFERFYRAAGKHRQTTAGLGIGLSIAQQIIEHYEGKLWVESVEGQGSTFSFSLPR